MGSLLLRGILLRMYRNFLKNESILVLHDIRNTSLSVSINISFSMITNIFTCKSCDGGLIFRHIFHCIWLFKYFCHLSQFYPRECGRILCILASSDILLGREHNIIGHTIIKYASLRNIYIYWVVVWLIPEMQQNKAIRIADCDSEVSFELSIITRRQFYKWLGKEDRRKYIFQPDTQVIALLLNKLRFGSHFVHFIFVRWFYISFCLYLYLPGSKNNFNIGIE